MAEETSEKSGNMTLGLVGLALLLLLPLVGMAVYMFAGGGGRTSSQVFQGARSGGPPPVDAGMPAPAPATPMQAAAMSQSMASAADSAASGGNVPPSQSSLQMLRGGSDFAGTAPPKPAEPTSASEQLGVDTKMQSRGYKAQAAAADAAAAAAAATAGQAAAPPAPARKSLQPMKGSNFSTTNNSNGFNSFGNSSFGGSNKKN